MNARDALVGRRAELDHLASLVGPGRLVTVTGPGGVGKSATVLAFADEHRASFDAAWVCDLGSVSVRSVVPAVVASAIGVVPTGQSTLMDAIAATVRPRRVLLVLDNADQVATGVAQFVAALAATCPDLRVVVTSRSTLRLPDEVEFALPRLDLDRAAPELFTRRAELVAGVDLTGQRDAVDRLCAMLDGVPLAIELVVARLADLTLDVLVARLNETVRRQRLGDRSGRHDALDATLRWTADSLGPDERRAFDALSVFHGGFDEAGATAVLDRDIGHVPRVLEALAARSLIVPVAGTDRWSMLETVRQHGDRGLAGRRERAVRRNAHLDHMIGVAATIGAESAGSQWSSAVDRIRREFANLRAAVHWAIDAQRLDDVERILGQIHFVCRWSGELEPATWAARAVERADATHSRVGAAVLLHLVFERVVASDPRGAAERARRALEVAGTPAERAAAVHDACGSLLTVGRTAEAWTIAESAAPDPAARPIDRVVLEAARAECGAAAQALDPRTARRLLDGAGAVADAERSPVGVGLVALRRAAMDATAGRPESAVDALDRALALVRTDGVAVLRRDLLVALVAVPLDAGLAAAATALEDARTRSDPRDEEAVLEALAVRLGEQRRFEPAATILGHLGECGSRLVSLQRRRVAVETALAAQRRGADWRARGAAMPRSELLDVAVAAGRAAAGDR